MIVIGLCGGSGSGKSTVAKIFQSHGASVLDADAIYHELTSSMTECLLSIREAFGEGVIQDNALNRNALSKIVFSGENASEKRLLLNSITHKYVKDEMIRRMDALAKEGVSMVVLDVPLLFESGIDKLCDCLVCVTAPLEARIQRLLSRDGITREKALARIRSQHTDEFLISHTHFHILNASSLEDTSVQVNNLIKNKIKVGKENG